MVTISLQVPAELKSRLQAFAVECGRTLSQEAQWRLERSFSVQADAVALAVSEALDQANALFEERIRQIEKNISDQFEKHAWATAQLAAQLAERGDSNRPTKRGGANE
jgi:hypothetical protein